MVDNTTKAVVVSSFIFTIFAVLLLRDLRFRFHNFDFRDKYDLIVGILSAPDNFLQRESLRRSWLKLSHGLSVRHYFLVGNDLCDVPVVDRINPESCKETNISLPKDVIINTEFSPVVYNRKSTNQVKSSLGFVFSAQHVIIIRKLGISSEFLKAISGEVQVKIVSSYSPSETLSFATFAHESSSTGFVYKQVPLLKVPKHYELWVKLDGPGKNFTGQGCQSKWNNQLGVIYVSGLLNYKINKPVAFTSKSCVHVNFIFTIHELNSLQNYLNGTEKRRKKHLEHNKQLKTKLSEEIQKNQDIFLLNVLDVYNNLTLKVTTFLSRILEEKKFRFILKTDDDSFVDLKRLYHTLAKVDQLQSVSHDLWVWSFFKRFWKVQTVGKWRDDEYESVTYPPFPCGGGYVLSKAMAKYIAANRNNLHMFQGEDVSVGIWLSGLNVVQYEVEGGDTAPWIQSHVRHVHGGWQRVAHAATTCPAPVPPVPDQCEWTCGERSTTPACNRVQLSIDGMMSTWSEYVLQGYL